MFYSNMVMKMLKCKKENLMTSHSVLYTHPVYLLLVFIQIARRIKHSQYIQLVFDNDLYLFICSHIPCDTFYATTKQYNLSWSSFLVFYHKTNLADLSILMNYFYILIHTQNIHRVIILVTRIHNLQFRSYFHMRTKDKPQNTTFKSFTNFTV